MTIGPFALLILAIPILLLGELLAERVGALRRSHIPPPIIGGLLVALALLAAAQLAPGAIVLQGSTHQAVWLWPVLPDWGFVNPGPLDVERPLLILFFTCIGLNASWALARSGGWPLLVFLGLSAAVAIVQATSGAVTAVLLGESPLLGLMSSNVSLMGGFGTAAGFAAEFERAGLAGAATIGFAAAAFGVIAGGLIAGAVGGSLVTRQVHRVAVAGRPAPQAAEPAEAGGFLGEVRQLAHAGRSTLLHLALLVACMKLGAFVSAGIQQLGLTFPVYMGSMIVAALARNLHDLAGSRWLSTDRTDAIGSVALAWLLAVVMIDLQLAQLAHAAVPMLVILGVQVAILSTLSAWAVFRLMGRDYEAAVMSAGMIGFGLGATSNAMATMRVLTRRYGPAPRAFLIVPVVGAFLIDFCNALLTTAALNLFD